MVGNVKFSSRMNEPRSPRANQQSHHLAGLFRTDRLPFLTFHKPTSSGIAAQMAIGAQDCSDRRTAPSKAAASPAISVNDPLCMAERYFDRC
jgi:hypothetical protein